MNRFFTVSALVVLAASLTACESPLSLGELRALADAEARWAGRGFQDYTFEIRRSCFCEPLITQWARVEVVGGQMTRVVLLDTGAEVPPAQRGRFVTVEQVFTSIRAANQNELVDDVIVEYDQQLGFPTRVRSITRPDILDGGDPHQRPTGDAPRQTYKKTDKPSDSSDDLRPEYDFTGGVRGKYAQRFREGTNIVVLDPDVAAEFKDSQAVNDALRRLLKSRAKG